MSGMVMLKQKNYINLAIIEIIQFPHLWVVVWVDGRGSRQIARSGINLKLIKII